MWLDTIKNIMLSFDLENKYNDFVIGVDEVGYGAWAGPLIVVACAIKKRDIPRSIIDNINDSKLLSKAIREKIYTYMCQNDCCVWEAVEVSSGEIDKSNVLAANLKAIELSLEKLAKHINISHVLIDGIHLPKNLKWSATAVKGGDKISYSIALASILAKVTRDNIMVKLHEQNDVYSWHTNVGYGTLKHRLAIEKFGVSMYHRLSYKPLKKYT